MKEIINGRKYDTETAKKIASYCNGESTTSFEYYYEELYKKKTGEFFLAGEGGALSRYAESCPGGGYCGGKKIIPISLTRAKEWMERVCDAETYEELFGTVEE